MSKALRDRITSYLANNDSIKQEGLSDLLRDCRRELTAAPNGKRDQLDTQRQVESMSIALETCTCRYSDAWRCAVDRRLTRQIACHCKCHRATAATPTEPPKEPRDSTKGTFSDWFQEETKGLLTHPTTYEAWEKVWNAAQEQRRG